MGAIQKAAGKGLAAVLAASLLIPVAAAQKADRPSPIGPDLETALKQHPLTRTQRQRLQAVQQRAGDQIVSLRGNPRLTAAQKNRRIRQLRAGTRTRRMAVLTPDQRREYEQWARSRAGSRAPRPAAPGPPARAPNAPSDGSPEYGSVLFLKQHPLTPAQWQQLRAIETDTREEIRKVRSTPGLDTDEVVSRLRDLRSRALDRVFGILSPAQKEELWALWQEHLRSRTPPETRPAPGSDTAGKS